MEDFSCKKTAENLSCSLSQIKCSTDEDRYFMNLSHRLIDNGTLSSFGIFDGHGGKEAADFCSQSLDERIIQTYCELVNNSQGNANEETVKAHVTDVLLSEAIKRSFHHVDTFVKRSTDAGSTAVCIFVKELLDGSTRVLCPWIGDSRCVLYQTRIDTGEVEAVRMTEDHKPSLRREAERIAHKSRVIWTGEPQELGFGKSLLKAGSLKGSINTESISAETETRSMYAEGEGEGEGVVSAPRDEDDTIIKSDIIEEDVLIDNDDDMNHFIEVEQVSKTSFIERRGKHKTGPLAVFGRYGVSLCMTRSIGDRYGPRSCIAVPDISAVTIPAGHHARFVLASDGLWDVLTVEKVRALVYRHKNVQKVASLLSCRAWSKRRHLSMRPDDITVLVVDVNPDSFRHSFESMKGCVPLTPYSW
eukprot:CAMPEP_0182417266 /NCGR_PEP_ID=MMETSP1167-20130531/1693_1 /TAXON_ID=2988 /ORGANISM="Mallomonas Sp, Strain CCMP3275" /LENGTH=416 /DNA_ID=CAMNT_0024590685 /DNA_START=49 /DNA_END=1296 /DNA_ORIENTATION=-